MATITIDRNGNSSMVSDTYRVPVRINNRKNYSLIGRMIVLSPLIYLVFGLIGYFFV